MRHVVWTDRNGYLRRSKIRDADPDSMAELGVPSGPPDLRNINWEETLREINNLLVEQGLFTWDDVQRSQNGLQMATSIFKRRLAALYIENEIKSIGGKQ